MSVVTTQTNPKLLWPGQKALWGDFYNQHPEEYSQVFKVMSSDKAFEEFTGMTGLGLAPVKTQNQPYSNDTFQQGFIKRFTNVAYALGFQVTKEELADNQYEKATSSRIPMLARSMKQTIETVAANHFNRASNDSYPGADGEPLLDDSHPNVNGGTWSNELSTPADLAEKPLEDVCIIIDTLQDDRGLEAMLRPQKLVIPPAYRYTARRILESQLQNDTANNAKNVISNDVNGMVVMHFITDTDMWGVTTDVEHGLVFLERTAPEVEQDNDFATKNLLVSGYMRNASGWVDARGFAGSMGAA